jgi:hypothetical protein
MFVKCRGTDLAPEEPGREHERDDDSGPDRRRTSGDRFPHRPAQGRRQHIPDRPELRQAQAQVGERPLRGGCGDDRVEAQSAAKRGMRGGDMTEGTEGSW